MQETLPGSPDASVEAAREGSYVDWSCAIAGAFVAAAVAFVLVTFGSGIGLSLVSPGRGSSVSITAFALGATLWAVLVHVAAFGAGGYLAGRMRRPWQDATQEEIEFRDGTHGALVWAIGIVLGAALLAFAAAGTMRAGAQAAGPQVAGALAQPAAQGEAGNPVSLAVDALFRAANRSESSSPAEVRAEAARIVAVGIGRGELAPADRTYLAQLVAARTGLPVQQAEARVVQVMSEARAAADRARRAAVVAAFLAAATLLVGAAAAWSAARLGGLHREQGTVWRGFGRISLPGRRPSSS